MVLGLGGVAVFLAIFAAQGGRGGGRVSADPIRRRNTHNNDPRKLANVEEERRHWLT